MGSSYKLGLTVFLVLGLWSCTSPNDIVDYTDDLAVADPKAGTTSGFNEDKNGVRVVVDEFGGFVGLIGAEAVLAVLAGWWRKSNI